jgi:HAE1 family hydrophobic/amphiphilic exporter-1
LIRLAGKYKNVEELRNLVVSSKNGIQVRYRILPMFKMDKKQLKRLLVLIKRAIILQIVKQSDANAVAVSEQVYKTITKLENDYKDNAVKLNVANDSTILP